MHKCGSLKSIVITLEFVPKKTEAGIFPKLLSFSLFGAQIAF